MHMAVYAGTNARAVVHVHPPKVLAFSLTHDSFMPISFEEKYTIGEVPIIAQDTPTVTKPEKLAKELRYRPVAIIKGHGTVAIGKNFQEAFLFTDLLEEAVRFQFLKERIDVPQTDRPQTLGAARAHETPLRPPSEAYPLFSPAHMSALVETANGDSQF